MDKVTKRYKGGNDNPNLNIALLLDFIEDKLSPENRQFVIDQLVLYPYYKEIIEGLKMEMAAHGSREKVLQNLEKEKQHFKTQVLDKVKFGKVKTGQKSLVGFLLKVLLITIGIYNIWVAANDQQFIKKDIKALFSNQQLIQSDKNENSTIPDSVFYMEYPDSSRINTFEVITFDTKSEPLSVDFYLNMLKEGRKFSYAVLKDSLVFRSQRELDIYKDSFEIIAGDLIIQGSDITDLSNLKTLIEVKGNVTIANNPLLKKLDGIQNLNIIGGSLFLSNNVQLESLQNLEELRAVNRSVIISNPKVMTASLTPSLFLLTNDSINFLGVSKRLAGYNDEDGYQVRNEDVISINGKKELASVEDSLSIEGNPTLTECCGTDQLLKNEISGSTTSCEVEIIANENSIVVENLNNAHNKVYIYDKSFQTLIDSSCSYWNDCKGTKEFENLLPGVYAVQYQSFSDNWEQLICDKTSYVTVDREVSDDVCGNITFSYKKNLLTIENLSSLNSIIDLFTEDYSSVYKCVGDCGTYQSIALPREGKYILHVKFYDLDWKFICEQEKLFDIVKSKKSLRKGNNSITFY